MNKIITILATLLTIIIVAACTSEDFGIGHDTDATINLVIPEYPAAKAPEPGTRVSWNAPNSKGQWEDGDKLYITVYCLNDQAAQIGDKLQLIALRNDGQWVFSNIIQPPAGTERISVYAYYVVEYNNNPALNAVVLYSSGTYTDPITTILLNAFKHDSTRLTFTDLRPGDEISFREFDASLHPWSIPTYGNKPEQVNSIPTLTVGTDGTLEVYVNIHSENKSCNFRINGQPSGEWYSFNPEPYPEGKPNYKGQHYIINCLGL